MRVVRHRDAWAFWERAAPLLVRAEGENCVILSVALALRDGAMQPESPPYAATVEDAAGPLAAALRTAPAKLILTRASPEAARLVAGDAGEVFAGLPGVLAPDASGEAFASAWAEAKGVSFRAGPRQTVYQLDRVTPPTRPAPGGLRQAAPEDRELIAAWIEAFVADTHVADPIDARRTARAGIADGLFFLWQDAAPVSLAGYGGLTPNGARVRYVFTPREQRGRGYASACVAALSQRLLDSGRRHCFLYTDRSDPGPSRIYRRLGYRAVCDATDYLFSA